jgi:CO dehydrogenase/acetyl-CoA synthase beta subunit
MRAVCENIACLKRLKKQKKFLKSKGKDIVCCSLKTLDKLKEAKEKERQIESERATAKATAMPFNVLALLLTKANPFAGVKVPLLPLEV